MFGAPKMSEDEPELRVGLLEQRPEASEFSISGRPRRWLAFQTSHSWLIHMLFFAINLFLFLAILLARSSPSNGKYNCSDYLPMWSPALEAVQETGFFERFDGSFEQPNRYKGVPNDEIDASWQDITYATGGVIAISDDILDAVNASRSQYTVKLSEENGGGYMASVEVLHQLHCLDMLRKATYEDYYRSRSPEWTDSTQTLRYHLDHCIDNLRQKLMCDADTGILTYVWVEGHAHPFPDFNVQHKCRSFDAVKQWVTGRQLVTMGNEDIVRVEGAENRPTPP